MFFIKMMSNEDIADSSTSKSYTLIQVETLNKVVFSRRNYGGGEFKPVITIYDNKGQEWEYYPDGSTYVMNEAGKTIATYALGSELSNSPVPPVQGS